MIDLSGEGLESGFFGFLRCDWSPEVESRESEMLG